MEIDFNNVTINSIPPSIRRGITDEEIVNNYKEDMRNSSTRVISDRDKKIIESYVKYLKDEKILIDASINVNKASIDVKLKLYREKNNLDYLVERLSVLFDSLDGTEYYPMELEVEEV